jgi:phage-related protein (TIGR01555 family)
VLVDSAGNPLHASLTRGAFEVVIGEKGKPMHADGRPVLEHRLPREDAFLGPGWSGSLGGYGNPGYRGATFQNRSTGIGTARDKTTWGNYWQPWRIMDAELLAMFNGSDLAAKIILEEPGEMFRNGWEVRSRDVDDDALKKLDKKAADLRLNELLLQGTIWGRLFGGALDLVGAEDGRLPDQELNENSIKTVHYLNVVDRRFVWVQRYYSDMLSPKFGLPEVYLVTNMVSSSGMLGTGGPAPGTRLAAVSIHESRCIRFDGAESDVLTRQQLAGWTFSILQRCYDPLRRFEGSEASVDNLLADASQAVYKIKGLLDMIAQNQKDALLTRMQLVDMSRSVLRGIMVDADMEDFERKPTTFTGIPEIMDRKMMRLAACAGMPVTRLFGRAAAGLNATGEGDERIWLSKIRSKQENDLSPKLKRVYRLFAAAADSEVRVKEADFQIEFGQLYEPTELEQADRELKVAQRDQIYLDEGVVTPEEVKLGRFGSGKFSSWIDVDADALQEAIDGAVKFDPYANEPVPEGALASGNAGGQGEMQSPVVPLPLPGSPDLPPNAANRAESPQRDPKTAPVKKKDSRRAPRRRR